jgi:hypothetical protein
VGTLQLAGTVLHATPEVTAANHKTKLDTRVHTFLNYTADRIDNFKVQTSVGFSRQSLSADFQQNPLILNFRQAKPLLPFLTYFNIKQAN